MKIIFPLLSLEHHGGVRDIVEIANYLVNRGHKVIIYVPRDRYKKHYPLSEKVILKKIPLSGKSALSQFQTLLWYLLKLERADLYVANFFPTFYPLFIRSLINITPFAYFVQDIESRFVRFPLNTTAFLTYLLPSTKIALSTYIKRTLRSKHIKIARAGVSGVFFKKDIVKRDFNFPLTIGHIFRRERLKNSSLFLKALPEITKIGFKVLLVANRKDISFSHNNIKVIPYGNSEYLRDNFYDKIDVFIHTSFVEGFGLPPLEAMSRGCVVLLTESGGPSEYTNPQNSITIDKYDPNDIISKLSKLRNNPILLQNISQNAVRTAKEHPMTRIGKEFESALYQLRLLK